MSTGGDGISFDNQKISIGLLLGAVLLALWGMWHRSHSFKNGQDLILSSDESQLKALAGEGGPPEGQTLDRSKGEPKSDVKSPLSEISEPGQRALRDYCPSLRDLKCLNKIVLEKSGLLWGKDLNNLLKHLCDKGHLEKLNSAQGSFCKAYIPNDDDTDVSLEILAHLKSLCRVEKNGDACFALGDMEFVIGNERYSLVYMGDSCDYGFALGCVAYGYLNLRDGQIEKGMWALLDNLDSKFPSAYAGLAKFVAGIYLTKEYNSSRRHLGYPRSIWLPSNPLVGIGEEQSKSADLAFELFDEGCRQGYPFACQEADLLFWRSPKPPPADFPIDLGRLQPVKGKGTTTSPTWDSVTGFSGT